MQGGKSLGFHMSDDMEQHTSDFEDLVNRLRDGSEEAALELFELCKGRVYAAVRRRLNRQMRSKFDSHDFVQAMWASFYTQEASLPRFEKEEDLVAYLIRIVGNKVTDEYRKRTTEKYSMNRERRLESPNDSMNFTYPSTDPSPSQHAMANEQWTLMLDRVPPKYRKIVELRRDGAKLQEIADQLELSERTVRRILKSLSDFEVE